MEDLDFVLQLTSAWLDFLKIEGFKPTVSKSDRWREWKAMLSPTTCIKCKELHGTLYDKNEKVDEPPPLHMRCECLIQPILSILAGTATIDGYSGADYYIKMFNKLPDKYITKEEAKQKGWSSIKGNLDKVAPEKVIGGNVYYNDDDKLPSGRTWYEADINYTGGYRNGSRILYSDDGLVFVTFNHYYTFYEIK